MLLIIIKTQTSIVDFRFIFCLNFFVVLDYVEMNYNLVSGVLYNCHACMHGFIHDGQLQASQSCLLGLMYVLRLLYVIRCLRFQLVGGCIKGQTLPFSYQFSKIPLSWRISSTMREFLSQYDWISKCSQQLLHGRRLHTLHFFYFFAI